MIREDAEWIIQHAVDAVQPGRAVRNALQGQVFPGKVILISVGKAAWNMAKTACDCLGDQVHDGIVITKYGHSFGPIGVLRIREAGHPVPDENGIQSSLEAMELVSGLCPEDTVVLLLSGGGSALFEVPLVSMEVLQSINSQLLARGADIVEINTVRKRLSAVKGGRFAQHCAPARVFCVILSDVIGDRVDMIASGPACPDSSTCAEAIAVAEKYALELSAQGKALLEQETPKALSNVTLTVSGSVGELCRAAAKAAGQRGYTPLLLTESLCCQAVQAGEYLAREARKHTGKTALIAGGETVVMLTGDGKGGRNQELALSAARFLKGRKDTCLFSLASDGTDGPTDAAGGIVDGATAEKLASLGIDIDDVLRRNDSYHALAQVDGLLFTGPTGTNVNDVAVVLIGSEA